MKIFRTYFNSKSMNTLTNIIATEALDVSLRVKVDALGDTIIEVSGIVSEVRQLEEIYRMVA